MPKVYAKNADMVRLLKHPTAGGFRDLETPAEWPDDSFTFRRIRDGDVSEEEPSKKKEEPVADAPQVAAPVDEPKLVVEDVQAVEVAQDQDASPRRRK